MVDALYYLVSGVLLFCMSLPVLLGLLIFYGVTVGAIEARKNDALLAASLCPRCKTPFGKKAISQAHAKRNLEGEEIRKRNPGAVFRFSSVLEITCLSCGHVSSTNEAGIFDPLSAEERSRLAELKSRWKSQRHAMLDLANHQCPTCNNTYGAKTAAAARRAYVALNTAVPFCEYDQRDGRDKEWRVECPNCHAKCYFNYLFEVLHALPRKQRLQKDSDSLDAFADWKSQTSGR